MSTGDQPGQVGAADTERGSRDHLVELVERRLGTPAEAYAAVREGDCAFVVAAWRADDTVVRSVRFACRVDDGTVTRVGARNTHHVERSVGAAEWSRQFLRGREKRAIGVARAQLDWERRPSRRPFDGPFFGNF